VVAGDHKSRDVPSFAEIPNEAILHVCLEGAVAVHMVPPIAQEAYCGVEAASVFKNSVKNFKASVFGAGVDVKISKQ
jgi:hypothetical protein